MERRPRLRARLDRHMSVILTSRANPGYQALRALAEDRRARRQAGATLIDG